MQRASWWGSLLALAVAAAACETQPTGLLADVQLGALRVDELRFQVALSPDDSLSPSRVLVDALSNGRIPGPFAGAEARQPIYFDDALADHVVTYTVSGAIGGQVAASVSGSVRVQLHRLVNVTLTLAAGASPPDGGVRDGDVTGSGGAALDGAVSGTGGLSGIGGAPGTGGVSGIGGASGTGGISGIGGASGTGGATGTGGNRSKADGTACQADGECANRHCVDGVCCADSCTGACRACNLSGAPGRCLDIAAGVADPRGMCADLGAASCNTNGRCDGAGNCARYPAGTACSVASCKNQNMAVPVGVCDMNGKCNTPPVIKCPPGASCLLGLCL
jgi:hypothetical protein